MMDIRSKLEAALAKPIAEDAHAISVEDFDPWADVIDGIDGSYAAESDALMIEALEAARDGSTFEYIDANGFAGEFMLYVLSGHGYLECGTSPRGGWPSHEIQDLWQPLIDKWLAHYTLAWGEPLSRPASAEPSAPSPAEQTASLQAQ